ncbi:hypothetical protein [Chryseosolibacter indicus]|uniref:DUF4890 domain-containing protein n=1 Tax=Chryseosolibacter indicus TaxID=2782351 RepID=A0ABS5VSM1_9BACT|nr:hypothetical protein [Chryseosolibacter indicus]MBT1704427.1 hypothetical protein [Chryseosolibacter indicus]
MTAKKLFIIATLCVTAFVVQAQNRMTEEQRQEMRERYEQYKTALNLTEAQQSQVEAINRSFFEGLAALRASPDSRLSKYKKYKSLRDEKDGRMKEVLDDEQYKKYQDFQKEMKEEFKENRRRNH